jgi:hypothetical protein
MIAVTCSKAIERDIVLLLWHVKAARLKLLNEVRYHHPLKAIIPVL